MGQNKGGPAGHCKGSGFHSEIGTIEMITNNGLLSWREREGKRENLIMKTLFKLRF